MECPYCKQEMKPGYFYNSRQPLHWIPEDGKPSVFAYKTAKGGVSLRHRLSSGIGGYQTEAYYCADCHVVMAKTEN